MLDYLRKHTIVIMAAMALITLGYFVFHMTLAAWLFRKKEF